MSERPPATAEIAAEHGLTAEEWQKILKVLGRTPTLEELGVFSAMWSEHCSYKSSRVHLKSLPTSGPQVLQGPGENAGIVDIGDGLAAVFKIESHNHPSFIEPYQGAATGVGGILRDVFTMGARPIANLNSLRFGAIDHPRTSHLVKGVVAGIGGYGNCVGVATVGGEVYFDAGYNDNIVVNAFTLGLVRHDRIFRAAASGVANPVMYVGSRTGRDGIHGASMASAEFDENSEEKRPTVQVGDPFTEKLLLEACLELMEGDCLVAIQDMGAAGLTSSSVEMAGRGGLGIEIDLDRVPQREDGMSAYEILLSESQERMLLVAKAGREADVKRIFDKWDLQAVVVGRVTGDGIFRARWHGAEVAEIPVDPVSTQAPVYRRPAEEPKNLNELQELAIASVPEPSDYNQVLLQLLGGPNLCSKRWVFRQYDSMVRGHTVIGPGSDAAVLRIKGSRKGLAVTVDCNSRYCLLDPYVGAVIALCEAARNLVVSGARPLGLSDCLNFGNPEKPEVMWQFQQSIAGIRDACLALGVPVVSGNVSFYNDTEGRSIPPTPTIAMVGLLDDVTRCLAQGFRRAGDLILLIGRTREELGGSEYLAAVHGIMRGAPPWIDLGFEKRMQAFVRAAAEDGLLRSAHDVAEGGLGVALAECCLSSADRLGARIDLEQGMRADVQLFGESQSRVIVSVDRQSWPRLRDRAQREGIPVEAVGEVLGDRIEIGDWIDLSIAELAAVWEGALERALRVVA
ncbi:MAG TPA: phosphoribosylformylglycinamidine synthase subunit PurL [Candidatus Binatia bacterium]|nr:phosphoribosylformylglycinamidine synthase subunit PurL [Candidatus Binatia bacterium]